MKKLFAGILIGVLFLSIGSAAAFAAPVTNGVNYVDENNDDICDHCSSDKRCTMNNVNKKTQCHSKSSTPDRKYKNRDSLCIDFDRESCTGRYSNCRSNRNK